MKILLAVDDSKFSETATQVVISQFRTKGTEVEVLNIVDLKIPIPTSYAAGFREESLTKGQIVVERAEQLLCKAGFKVQTVVEEGDPKSRILDHAASWKADLIVLGSHGRTGLLDRFLLGSVSDAVARHAACSVEIVRSPA